MEIHSHSDMAALEKTNWWYVSRRRVLQSLLERYATGGLRVALDLGCGAGSHFELLKKYAGECIGLDISAEALTQARRYPYTSLVQASAEVMPLPDSSVDLVVCTDVLEHVNDEKTLDEIRRVLVPGGLVFIAVPAFMSLWNENDDYSHHLRRYGRRELKERVGRHGFIVHYSNFWNLTFFVPVWIAARLYTTKEHDLRNNLTLIPPWMNGMLSFWMRCENMFGSRLPLPFGVSQVLVAEKSVGR